MGVLTLLFVPVLVTAVTAMALRRRRRTRLRRAAAARPGASLERAIPIRSYADMDDHLAQRWCRHCGGYLERTGEGSRSANGRRYRVARLRCQECERIEEVFFDTTDVLH
jgi:hypothetical protein